MSLVVTSQRITAEKLGVSQLSELLGNNSSCFIQNGEGMIGWGEALRLTATGATRFEELDDLWKKCVSEATVDDQANLPSSGLIAFGSIAFADGSESHSVLVVPQLIIGNVAGEFFITAVNTTIDQAIQQIAPAVKQPPLTFIPGAISPELFCSNVSKAIDLITQGQISKVVLARDLVAETKKFNPNYGLAKMSERFA
ncbi:MAG: hypothetical protein RLZZ556_1007, partial [Actinomycetota bacterium]